MSHYSLIAMLCFGLYEIVFQAMATHNPTKGFTSLPFNSSFYHIQKPYDRQENERYSFINGVHKLWVFDNDKPLSRSSPTKPRTEIIIQGYSYSSGVWAFEGDAYVPKGTSGVCIMQVFGAHAPHATTLMLRVYNGSLMYYRQSIVVSNIYDRWFRVNVLHNVDKAKVKVYIDGHLKLEVAGRGGTSHYFKCGVYAQNNDSSCMESQWKNINVLKQLTLAT